MFLLFSQLCRLAEFHGIDGIKQHSFVVHSGMLRSHVWQVWCSRSVLRLYSSLFLTRRPRNFICLLLLLCGDIQPDPFSITVEFASRVSSKISGRCSVMDVIVGFTFVVLEKVLRYTRHVHHRAHFPGIALCAYLMFYQVVMHCRVMTVSAMLLMSPYLNSLLI